MVYGETDTFSTKIDIETRIISFWTNLIDFKTNRLSNMVYHILNTLYELRTCKTKWLDYIKSLLTINRFGNIWINHYDLPRKWIHLSFKQTEKDLYLQSWDSLVNKSSGAANYRIFKNKFGLNKNYHLLNNKQCRILTAFRTRNHRLPVETGRWNNTPLNGRICNLCRSDIGDEFHFVLKCDFFKDQRLKLIRPYYRNRSNSCQDVRPHE